MRLILVTLPTRTGGQVQRWIRNDFRAGVFRTREDAAHDLHAAPGRRYEVRARHHLRGATGTAWRDGVKIADVIEVTGTAEILPVPIPAVARG